MIRLLLPLTAVLLFAGCPNAGGGACEPDGSCAGALVCVDTNVCGGDDDDSSCVPNMQCLTQNQAEGYYE
jgi:hypothetical protein